LIAGWTGGKMQSDLEAIMTEPHRSGCPINLTLEVLGDRWSLIVIRDIMFGNRRHFRELLQSSEEGIASNILADRLKRLVDCGLLTRGGDITHRQKAIYSLTDMAIDLVPLLAHMGAWGRRYLETSEELGIRAELLEAGGPRLWDDLMDELRARHLGKILPPGTPSVLGQLTEAYLQVVKRTKGC
jgi:DNA-binding HxlR family transcriptional regulator